MENKLISVIIPHYNSLDSLAILLKTIPDISHLEILIVDDNSDIDFEKISSVCSELFHNASIIIFRNKNGRGAGKCRNIGLDHATGKWCVFADADDLFTKNAFKTIMALSCSNSDLIYFKPTSLDLRTKAEGTRHRYLANIIQKYLDEPNRVNELKVRTSFSVPWSKMIRNSLIQKHNIKFDDTIVANDVMFSTKVGMMAEKIEVKSEVVYCVTQGENTLTSRNNPERLEVRAKVYCDYYNYLKKNMEGNEFYKAVENQSYSFLQQSIKNHFGLRELFRIKRIITSNMVPIDYMKMIMKHLKCKKLLS